ncbi:MAG TPA: hypothetical protein VFO59_06665 [Dehalococcoidia bacterium]|nr:hypothetical protein [Dehalococcoidia bacterium]
MLDVAYEAVDDLPPGRLAQIDEDRGRIRIRLARTAPLDAVIGQLNIEADQLVRSARWFQLWKDEIVSCNTPDRPLRVEYLLEKREPHGAYIEERKGTFCAFVDPALDTEKFAAVMNPVTVEHLAGGHWFQLYGGEIIDNSPEPITQA